MVTQSRRHPTPIPFIGFAIPALPPSAATLSASIIVSRAPSGKSSKAFRAGVSHEIGRVGLIHLLHITFFYVGRFTNTCQI
jgi:hypothetical protein